MLDRLLSPLALGPVQIRNRIVSTAHQTHLVEGGLPTDALVAYHEARARGGAGMIVVEATAVDESGLLDAHSLAGFDERIVAGYRRVAAAVGAHGCRLFVQLFHGGREQIASAPRPPAVAPSAIPSQRFKTEPRSLREEEIARLVAGFGRAAGLAAEGGLDGVEISAAHGYLVAQFFTPALNRRDDRWSAGSAFLVAVIQAVRTAAPGLAVGVRLSADSPAAQRIARDLAGRADYLSLALGESSTYRGSSGIVPPPPVPRNAIVPFAGWFRVGPPLIATSRIIDPREADRLIAEGAADAVGMTRALIADPDLPAKAAAGQLADVLGCVACNACIAHYHAGTPIRCAINPRTGRERSWSAPTRASRPARLVVVGAGPAGLAAAAEARRFGHRVVLVERTERIGGQLALAGGAALHEETARTLADNYRRMLDGVELRLGEEADAELVGGLEADAVVVATGAMPYRPPLPLTGAVVHAWDVLAGERPRGAVVVADWGGDPSGLAAADVLAHSGAQVTLALASVAAGEGMHQYARNLALERLYRAGVRIEHHAELVRAEPGVVVLRNPFAPELETALSADALVLALGRVPEDGLAARLRGRGLRVHEAGDCLGPRSLEEATLEGALAARTLTVE